MKTVTHKSRILLCYILRLPHHTTCILFGEKHHPLHVMLVGLLVIFCGSWIQGIECHGVVRHLCESSGMFVHGIGSYPIIEHIKKAANSE